MASSSARSSVADAVSASAVPVAALSGAGCAAFVVPGWASGLAVWSFTVSFSMVMEGFGLRRKGFFIMHRDGPAAALGGLPDQVRCHGPAEDRMTGGPAQRLFTYLSNSWCSAVPRRLRAMITPLGSIRKLIGMEFTP